MTTTIEAWRRSVDLLLWLDFCEPSTDEEAERWYDTGLTPTVAVARIIQARQL
jgi:hypothetical protein